MQDRSLNLVPASVTDYRESARRRLPRQLFDYIDGGAYDEVTLAANTAAWQSIEIRQRVLRNVDGVDTSTTVLGQPLAMPVILAPVGLAGMFATRAEVQAAKAAARAKVPFVESTVSICGIEEVAKAVEPPPWFQLYVMRDREYAESLLSRATAVGSPVLMLTVDLAVVGERYRDVRNGMSGSLPPLAAARRGLDLVSHPGWIKNVALGGKPLTFGNLETAVPGGRSPQDFRQWVDSQFDPSVTWDDLAWVRKNWPGKIVLKGILDAEDARVAADLGMDGIVVSNHGGRQLDSTPATARALPAIVDAVGDGLEILVDGGIRSGLDVTKALSMGAAATLIGRPWAYAVAGRGQAGVRHVLHLMRKEMIVAMSLAGVTGVDQLNPDCLAAL